MSRKPRLLLLDAGAIFAAMHHEAWDALVAAYDVLVPSTVVRVEAVFYEDRDGHRREIDLPTEVGSGRIQEIAVDASDMARVVGRFSPEFRERLDAGELEAIAFLVDTTDADLRFVSGDGPAIQAAVMLDTASRVMSLQDALDLCGQSKPLARHHRREFVQKHATKGSVRRIQGRGLA